MRILRASILLAAAFLGFAGAPFADKPVPALDAWWCPHLPTLHPGRVPVGFRPLVAGEAACVRRLRGEQQAVVLALRARTGTTPVRVSITDVEDLRPLECTVGVITFVERRSPYVSLVARRQGAGRRVRVWPLADAIVPDEPAWQTYASSWTRDTRYPARCGAAAATTPAVAGALHYFLLDVAVPSTAPAGRRTVALDVAHGEATRRLTVEVDVLPDRIAPHNKVVSLANDLDDDATLGWLGALGCTALRARDLSRHPNLDRRATRLRALGFRTVIQHAPPQTRAEVEALPECLDWYFYGRDEPQPKPSQGRAGWEAMAEHVRRSAAIHACGGRVVTSLPYVMAEGLAVKGSDLYGHLAAFGLADKHEPLDYANYGAGINRIGSPRWNVDGLHTYVARLQVDVREGRVDEAGRPRCKHDRLESYYAPLGMARDPFHARLLFGLYLHRSRLDGAFGWTLWRPRGNPLDDADGPDATLAYPAAGGVISTYTAEAARAGVNDLRLVALVASRGRLEAAEPILQPFDALQRDGRPLDQVLGEGILGTARERLLDLVEDAR